jgi:uncharacterized membrane protein
MSTVKKLKKTAGTDRALYKKYRKYNLQFVLIICIIVFNILFSIYIISYLLNSNVLLLTDALNYYNFNELANILTLIVVIIITFFLSLLLKYINNRRKENTEEYYKRHLYR